uniref:Jacalin-type lectin domain-containing protein n=1 Tax=Kalanchoe fedtschenkoi TaxID=63787 RepID=A0A7N0VDT8_KALFE
MVVKLDYPREYLTYVTIYGNATGIAFKTNLGKTHGSFGNGGDPTACFCLGDENQFGGFHGAADSWGICSIGVYIQPKTYLEDNKQY